VPRHLVWGRRLAARQDYRQPVPTQPAGVPRRGAPCVGRALVHAGVLLRVPRHHRQRVLLRRCDGRLQRWPAAPVWEDTGMSVSLASDLPISHVIGLDLGFSSDYTALVILERSWRPRVEDTRELQSHYDCRHIRRWPLKTAYGSIVDEVVQLSKSSALLTPM